MIARRPTIACISAVERIVAARIAARADATRATTYPTAPAIAIVASADGKRNANSVTPKTFANSAAIQK